MQVAARGPVLGSIVLLACVGAAVAVTGILFVLYGPVPVRRTVTMVSRVQPSMPVAAMPVMFEYRPSEPVAVAAVEPPPVPLKKAKAEAPIAPLQLRRPRESPPPLPRLRAARGTQHRGFEPEMTMPEAPPFEVDDPTFRDAR